MSTRGQLLQEPVSYTAIESLPPEWIKHWWAPLSGTELISYEPWQTSILVVRCFERSFVRPRPTPLLRFTYSTSADCLADLMSTRSKFTSETPIDAVGRAPADRVEDEPVTPTALVTQILDWLQVTYEELAQITGVSRSALFHWRKTGVTPRASHRRQV